MHCLGARLVGFTCVPIVRVVQGDHRIAKLAKRGAFEVGLNETCGEFMHEIGLSARVIALNAERRIRARSRSRLQSRQPEPRQRRPSEHAAGTAVVTVPTSASTMGRSYRLRHPSSRLLERASELADRDCFGLATDLDATDLVSVALGLR